MQNCLLAPPLLSEVPPIQSPGCKSIKLGQPGTAKVKFTVEIKQTFD